MSEHKRSEPKMKILFFCTAFNSLSQRVALVLKSHGHAVTVELALSSELMISAAELASPDIIICPFLTKRVPPVVYNRWLTLIVHPGPPGDAGPSALDWTLIGDLGRYHEAEIELDHIDSAQCGRGTQPKTRSHWGVTVLQAIETFDAGPVWAFDQFELDRCVINMTKSDLYRGPVTRAAVNAVLAAVEIVQIVANRSGPEQGYSVNLMAPEFARKHCVSKGLPFQGGQTCERPLLKASSRDFFQLSRNSQRQMCAETVVQRIRSGDSQPGVLTGLFGTPLFVYDATIERTPLPLHAIRRAHVGGPGTVLATRDGAVLVDVGVDYPIWISHLRRPKSKADRYLHPKLPATMALLSMPEHAARLELLSDVEEWPLPDGDDIALPWMKREGTYQQVWVELESCENGKKIGYVHSEFYNGAFSTAQCETLLNAIIWTLSQPDLAAIVMLGGTGYFSNGIALNVIEGSPDPSAEGWANINAIDDCVQALLAPRGVLTFAAIRGNAAAGGLALATAADVVICAESAVLNPHYRGIGLYGSEWHTYSWYERCGTEVAAKLVHDMLPMSSHDAEKIGLVDHVIDNRVMNPDGLLSEVKSIVRNIMTARAGDVSCHIGATWTRPLRPVVNYAQLALSEYMLRNKAKFLAYLFAGQGQDQLTVMEHFQQYRRRELDQMTLDFFHTHRNKRFATRCTAFVRKLVPSSTPLRFALHRRHPTQKWYDMDGEILHRDEEEQDSFDDLGQHPASTAVPRLPLYRPQYIQKSRFKADMHRLCPSRQDSAQTASSTTSSSAETPGLSSPASTGTSTPPALQPSTPPAQVATDLVCRALALESPVTPLTDQREPASKTAQLEAPILWSCYYSENGT